MECFMSKSIGDTDTSCRQIQNNHGENCEEEVLSEIWDSHGGDYKEYNCLSYDFMQSLPV